MYVFKKGGTSGSVNLDNSIAELKGVEKHGQRWARSDVLGR